MRTSGGRSALVERAELLGDIRHDPAVRGRGRREHGNPGGDARDEVAQPPVVGAEVVPPVADAVRLVDDEQSDPRHQLRQLLVAERRVVEPLGRHQQHVDLVTVELCEHVAPLVRVRGVDRDRPHTRTLRRGDLVAHESQQRRDQHGGPGAAPAQEQRRDEVHRRLAPPGALHHECPAAAVDERLDRLELAVVEVGVVTADERAQDVECLGPHGRRRGHALYPAPCHRREGEPAAAVRYAAASSTTTPARPRRRTSRLRRSDMIRPRTTRAARKRGKIHIPVQVEIAPNNGGAKVEPV